MHELSLCQGIVRVLEEQAGVQGYRRVTTVWLEVGALAGVELDALRFGFDVVTHDTLAEGAKLEVVAVPGQAWCAPCAKSVPVRERFDPCPECGGYRLRVTGGEELRVKELEVE